MFARMRGTRRQKQTRTRRPRILRYRWWLVVRSRRGTRAALVFLVAVLVVAYAARGRMTAQQGLSGDVLGTPPT
jgi:hypothetical protein